MSNEVEELRAALAFALAERDMARDELDRAMKSLGEAREQSRQLAADLDKRGVGMDVR